jgi:pimeloyl-ACP methyl ester carboxylesterase
MTEPSSPLVAWGGVGRTADLGGAVHYVDFGGAAGAPRVVLVHGLGGSHLNWCLLAPSWPPAPASWRSTWSASG